MTDKQIIDWMEERKLDVERMPETGTWIIDFGLHYYEANTIRECVEHAAKNEHLIAVC